MVIGGVLSVAGVIVGWVGWSAKQGLAQITVLDPKKGDVFKDGPYLGSKACAECHPGEYAFFTRSGHARTLRAAAEHSTRF